MDDNASYYGGGGDEPTATNESGSDSADQESSGDAKTFLMNSDACPGMTVGQEGRFKVLRILEKEYECEYLEDNNSQDQESSTPTASSDEEMNSYMG